MHQDAIIQPVRDRRRHQDDARIAMITGRRYVPKPTFFRNRETGEDYFALVGSVAFPMGRTPGFAVVAAAVKGENPEAPVIKVLDEIEETDLESLLIACEQRRHRWGYPHQLELWLGDPEAFMQAFYDFNDRLERAPDAPEGLYLASPADFEDHRRTEIYLQSLRSLLQPSPNGGGKRLFLGGCQRLRSHLQNMPAEIQKIEDHPAACALAFAAHTLLATAPWLEFTAPERLDPMIRDGLRHLEPDPWNDSALDDPEDDDGAGDDLVETVSYRMR